jgi:hypothetical protein
VHRGTIDWEYLTHNFILNLKFEENTPLVDIALQIIKTNIFTLEYSKILAALCSAPNDFATIQEFLECYNVVGED